MTLAQSAHSPKNTGCSRVADVAVSWATDALSHDDTTVSALARHLGVDWHTLWRAVKSETTRRTAAPGRMDGVRTLGVDEHI